MSRSFKIALVIILAGFLALVVVTIPRKLSRQALRQQNLRTAHALGMVCRDYKDDHDGRWPETLDALAPAYIEEDWVAGLGFKRASGEARVSWNYFPPTIPNPDPVEILIRSPEPHGRYIVVIYTDGSGQYLKDRIFARMEESE